MGQEEGSMGAPQDRPPRAQSRMGPAVSISLGRGREKSQREDTSQRAVKVLG